MTRWLLLLALALAAAPAAAAPAFEGAAERAVALAELASAPDLPVERADGELSIEERRAIQARLKQRRKQANAHQAISIAATGAIIATDVFGMINATALRLGSPTRHQIDGSLWTHRVLAISATSLYLTTGMLAWTMPKAYQAQKASEPRTKVDSGKLHVAFSVVHGIAMATVVGTGIAQANAAPIGPAWDALVTTHTVAGFTAAAFTLGAGIVIGTM